MTTPILSTHTYIGYTPSIGEADSLLGYDNNQQIINVTVTPDNALDGGVLAIPIERISKQEASNSTSISVTGLSSVYNKYELVVTNLQPQTNGMTLYLNYSIDNGANWINATNNAYTFLQSGTPGSLQTSAALTDLLGGADVLISNPAAYSAVITFSIGKTIGGNLPQINTFWQGSFVGSTNGFAMVNGVSIVRNGSPVNALQIGMSSGNITSGTFTLYGYL